MNRQELIEALERGETGREIDADVAKSFGAFSVRPLKKGWRVRWTLNGKWAPLSHYSESPAEVAALLRSMEETKP